MMNKNTQKIINYVLFFILIVIILSPNVFAARLDYNSLCTSDVGVRQAARIVGYLVAVARWLVPGIIMVLGMVDFFKVVISSDDKELSKATGRLIKRMIAGVIVFLVPTIILAILDLIQITGGIEKENNQNFGACTKCIFAPFDEEKCPKLED